MHSDMTFRINKPKVILESFEDEAVIVNLVSGNYFSLNRIGAEIFHLLECGASVMETVKAISNSYHDNQGHIEKEINSLVDQLLKEDLIVPLASVSDFSNSSVTIALDALNARSINDQGIFEPPVLQKYTDMQELLLLDPIHDVDDTGWPSKAKVG